MDFNKDRFLNFGRYDLTINNAFYRTMLLITLFGATGITAIGFTARWFIYKCTYDSIEQCVAARTDYGSSYTDYQDITTTFYALIIFITIMHTAFAGCTFHNLRNKQGRINELTLPATNLEKYTWHLLLVIVGGFAACIAAIVCADAFNAVLNLIVFPLDAQKSITKMALSIIFLVFDDESVSFSSEVFSHSSNIISAFRFASLSSSICGLMFYVFGNAVKYKYNIILTFITGQIILIVTTITFIIFFANTEHHTSPNIDKELGFIVILNIIGIFCTILSVVFAWGSYKLYQKAEITKGWNK